MRALLGVGTPWGLGGPADGWDVLPILAALFFLVLARRARRPTSPALMLFGALAAALATPVLEAWVGLAGLASIALGAWVLVASIGRRPRGGSPGRV